jgi:adenylosuccinate synthase
MDIPALRYVCRINGLTHINITKLDVLDKLSEIKVGTPGVSLSCASGCKKLAMSLPYLLGFIMQHHISSAVACVCAAQVGVAYRTADGRVLRSVPADLQTLEKVEVSEGVVWLRELRCHVAPVSPAAVSSAPPCCVDPGHQ